MFKQYLDILPEVAHALQNNLPVVALESTIISHGMPYPQNVEMANEVENIIRSHGAIPATIAILNGRLKVGLTSSELELLATSQDIIKASRRDLAFLVSQKKHGATTVASTMIIAALAGIKVFATGGIGGVHRGAETTFDISADLLELANTNVAVICAGAKSILDIGLTLEYLETHGVPVVGYQTKELPAFYTSSSGFEVDYKLDTPVEIAQALKTKWDLNLNGGVVIANPIPKEYEMDATMMNQVISQALEEQEQLGIKGKESTPFLLSKVKELTGGDSLSSNIQLVYNNAHLAAKIAVEYSKL
jgi:pseudouridine-5'-phosphate glycosidase